MKKIIASIVAAVLVVGFFAGVYAISTDYGNARKVLTQAGYTNVEITGYSWFSCGKRQSTGFKATGPTGQPAKGAVCSNLLWKNSVITFD